MELFNGDEVEARLLDTVIQDWDINNSVSRRLGPLNTFTQSILNHRMESILRNIPMDDIKDIYWGWRDNRMPLTPEILDRSENLPSPDWLKNIPLVSNPHSKCLSLSGEQDFDRQIPLAIILSGQKLTWISTKQYLEELENYWQCFKIRFLEMVNIVYKNYGEIYSAANVQAGSHRMFIHIDINYNLHIFDKNNGLSCPHYNR